MKNENGFVLVSVLIITTITTMLAFSQIKENSLQERISGNQQKEFNARLAAEKGIFDAFEFIAEKNADGISNAIILNAISESSFSAGENYSLENITLSGTHFGFVSKGSYNGAVAYLKTDIEAIEESGYSLFTDAVVGCDGVTVNNGSVDSYDSRIAVYDSATANKNGSISTINLDGDIELSGSGAVYGNVVSNGSISTGTGSATSISGDMTAAKNIQLKGITTSANIHAGGNFDYQTLNATGDSITIGGDITGGNGKNIITSAVTFGGVNSAGDFGTYSSDIVAPEIDFGECDPLDVATLVSDLHSEMATNGITAAISTITDSKSGDLIFGESSAQVFTADSSTLEEVSPVELTLLGETKKVYIFNNFNLKLSSVTISGDVTFFITGDELAGLGNMFTTSSTFSLADENSSLTIITDGKIDMNSLTNIFPGETINADGEVPLTVYSSYQGAEEDPEDAVNIDSNGNLYAKVYAPLGNLTLQGGGNIMGAVRGKKVKIPSATGIHYDEALADMIDIKDEETVPASYSAVYYYYP